MRKFASQHRGTPTVIEVECQVIHSQPWEIQEGEARYLVTAPKELAGEIWYSHSLYDKEEEAIGHIVIEITRLFNRKAEKERKPYDEEGCIAVIETIKTRKL